MFHNSFSIFNFHIASIIVFFSEIIFHTCFKFYYYILTNFFIVITLDNRNKIVSPYVTYEIAFMRFSFQNALYT